MSIIPLGSDKPTGLKVAYLAVVGLLGFILLWFLSNVPVETSRSNFYLIMLLLAGFGVLIDWVAKAKGTEIIDSVTEEPAHLRPFGFSNISYTWIFFIALVFTIITFITVQGSAQSIVGAPTFQAIPIEFVQSPYVQAFLSGIVGVIENFLFFAVMFPSFFMVFYLLFGRNWIIALVAAIILVSSIFMVYHYATYGTANISAFYSTFGFGAINCILVFLFRSNIIGSTWHFSNNFAVVLYQVVRVGL